ncbi:MAG: hypothetical protein Q9180_008011, partial [Flavoplaca navasiana]
YKEKYEGKEGEDQDEAAREEWEIAMENDILSESSGELLAEKLASIYGNFLQAVAFGNILYREALKITRRRLNLRDMSKHLPPESTAAIPVNQFLNYSLPIGLSLNRFSSDLVRVGVLMVDQYSATNYTLVKIGESPLTLTWLGAYTYAIGWKTS